MVARMNRCRPGLPALLALALLAALAVLVLRLWVSMVTLD
jgi:hypothetical protein